jgi:hypothetical protein
MSEAVQRQSGQMSAWLVFSGVAIGVVGASVNKRAEDVGELVVALGGRTDSSDVAIAVALGQLGLVLVVVGAVVVLAGLVVIALAGRHKRRRCAMDPDAVRLLAWQRLPCPQSRARGLAVPERRDCAPSQAGRLPWQYAAGGRSYLQHDHSCRSSSW